MAIEKHFVDRGFCTYFAEKVHSSDALTENIFRALDRSEYFVWIDFKREGLNADEYRGSLFVNQELAIATFLKLPVIGFLEKGVRREGIANYQIYNPIPFEDGTEIVSALERETSDWAPESVNELTISYDPSEVTSGSTLRNQPNMPTADWHHLIIRNRNKRKHALACMAYVTRIRDLGASVTLDLPTIELN